MGDSTFTYNSSKYGCRIICIPSKLLIASCLNININLTNQFVTQEGILVLEGPR